jgi:hypothetical protein
MNDALWSIAVVLAVLVLVELRRNGIFKRLASTQERIGVVLEKQTEFQQQNLRPQNMAHGTSHKPELYVPPAVRFCDFCRKELPESNHWWTVYHQFGYKLFPYPRQKEKPEDRWLHGEECIVAELQAYLQNVRRLHNKWIAEGIIGGKQTREYTERPAYGNEISKILVISSCFHCGKEYSEPDFWWTLSPLRGGMEIEITSGFKLYPVFEQANNYYFCQEECVVAAVRVFIGTQLGTLPPEAWEAYDKAKDRAYSSQDALPRD